MAAGDIPESLKQFVFNCIDSVEKLEVLLLLHGTPEQEWSLAEIYNKIRTQPESIAKRLTDLHHLGLIKILKSEAEPRYQYAVDSLERSKLVANLQRLNQERRVKLIELIFSKPSDKVRGFADAFKLRKD